MTELRRGLCKLPKHAACHEQRCAFTPFVASADGLMGTQAQAALKHLSVLLAPKWDQPYSQVRGYVNARLSIALVRASHRCLRGSRVPATAISSRLPVWDGSDAVALYS